MTLVPMFIDTGTGYAPARAMLPELTAQNMAGLVWLYWGGRRLADLYASVQCPSAVMLRGGVVQSQRRVVRTTVPEGS